MPRLYRVFKAAAAVLSLALCAFCTLGAADVPLEVGVPLHLDCGVRGHHRHCLWETEDGRVLQVEDVHAGRHAGLRAPDNLTHNQCGIVVEQASAEDAGAWTCTVFLPGEALTTVRSVGGRQARACYYPFEPVGSGCFHFGEDVPMTWTKGRDYCKSLLDGADLAVVDDCHLMQQLWSHITTTYGDFTHWIGATDEHKEGASCTLVAADVPLEVGAPLHLDCGVRGHHRHCLWETEDGRVLQVEDVHAGRHAGFRAPDNLTHNECGIVVEQTTVGDAGAWTCTVFLPGKALTTVSNVGGRNARACVSPFEPLGGRCLYFGVSDELKWHDARDFCRTLGEGADLAVVNDCNLMHEVWSHIMETYGKSDFWIGAVDEAVEGTWTWVDGTPVTMGTPYWVYDQPDNYRQEDCLDMYSVHGGYFNDHECTYYRHFICQDFFSQPL